MTPATTALPTPARYAGLDGLRAIAVTLVVVYHLFPGWGMHAGYVGVDVFFVISGFLITCLLLRERAATGRIGLVAFWRRRGRRLVPALVLMLGVCATAAWLIGGDLLVRLGAQLVGALTFSYNWMSVAAGADYFSASTPELFRNLWSLAVEEQFYVLWPLLLPVLLLLPGRWARVLVTVLLAGASAGWMALVVSDGGLTRAYFGTDTHAFGLLLGIALALALSRRTGAGTRARSRGWATGVGAAALAGVVAVAVFAPVGAPLALFPGALVAASVLTAVVIAVATAPGSALGRVLDRQPLRWIGDRSYAIYLWHWPLLVLLVTAAGTAADGEVPVALGLAALVLTVVAAELSHRLVETPVRRHGFRGSLALLGRRLAGSPGARFGAVASVAVSIAILGGAAAAIAAAPAETSAETAVRAGAEALQDASDAASSSSSSVPVPLAPPTAGADFGGAGGAGGAEGAGGAGSVPAQPAAPSMAPVTGAEITAIGDSVMLASAPALLERFPGIQVDAAVSRSMYAGPGIAEQLGAAGQLREYVVVALGTNGPIDAESLDRVAQVVTGPDRHLVLVTAFAPRDWIAGVNSDLAAFAASHPGVEVADWANAIAPQVDLLAGDEIHPGDAGGRVFADTVAGAIDRIELRRLAAASDEAAFRAEVAARLAGAA